ncbi:MAG: lipoate--protein ligase [Candidatus Promineifilaceae bacterium]|jgi:lipoate-protein ligase A
MICFENPQSTSPFVNLAIEEFLLRHVLVDQPILHFYVNSPVVIIGRNQNVFEEIDMKEVRKRGIPVLRRLSGGGAVYHDLGNINYSLISPDQYLLNNYEAFTMPVFNALRQIGLIAELRNRSSIFVQGKKVSGNAQYATKGRLLSHGTLLLNSDLTQLRSALQPRHQEISSRAIQSVRTSVANLRDLLHKEISLDEVMVHLKREFLDRVPAVGFELSSQDWEVIRKIEEDRYRSWEWNIGRSPGFTTIRRALTTYGELVLEIQVDKGAIQTVRLLSVNFKDNHAVNAFCDCLAGVRYDPQDIALALHAYGVEQNLLGLGEEELLTLIY